VSVVVLSCLLGILMAATAHLGCKVAERRARQDYRELVGDDPDVPHDGWEEIRPLVGRWGCLLAALEFLRGVGFLVALGAGLYLIVG